jgi:HSP20 family molecular chaperone IbpA
VTGGQVTISAADPEVWLVAAVPAAGYSVEVEKSGPEKVEVEFKSGDGESSFQAEFENGVLEVEIDDHEDD